MNKFTKESLIKEGQYLLYGPERKFVARFKHGGPFTMAKFRKELIAMHNPEEYFAKLRSGTAPLDILKQANKGWYDRIMAAFKLAA
jgi:hypothetical protein